MAISIRNCQVAAPLKLAVKGAQCEQVRAIRNCQVAAPLKLQAQLRHENPNVPSATVKLRPH